MGSLLYSSEFQKDPWFLCDRDPIYETKRNSRDERLKIRISLKKFNSLFGEVVYRIDRVMWINLGDMDKRIRKISVSWREILRKVVSKTSTKQQQQKFHLSSCGFWCFYYGCSHKRSILMYTLISVKPIETLKTDPNVELSLLKQQRKFRRLYQLTGKGHFFKGSLVTPQWFIKDLSSHHPMWSTQNTALTQIW